VGGRQASASRSGVPDDVRQSHLDEWQRFNKAASSFKASDGISQDEAEFLGEAYFVWQLGGCGFAGAAKESKTEWRMRPRVGLRGEPDSSYIRVDKRTGVVRYDSESPIAARDLIEIERRRLRKNLKEYVGEPAEEPANP